MIGTCQVSISGDVAPFNKTWALKTCLIDFYSVSKILMHQGEKNGVGKRRYVLFSTKTIIHGHLNKIFIKVGL